MAKRLTEFTQPNLLLVEGNDDVFFFRALVERLGLQHFQVEHTEGKSSFPAKLRARAEVASFSVVDSLGVVRDADRDARAAFQSVCNALKHAGLSVPRTPLLPTEDSPRVTVMIIPGGEERGALEDLCLKAVVPCPAMPCVDRFFHCLTDEGCPQPQNTSKARVQAFLASRERPGLLLGQAAAKGYWPWDSEAFEEVKDFLAQIVD